MPEKPTGNADADFKLEEQFILRVPEEVAKKLREAIHEGNTNLKDRLHVKLENDNRYGEVRFDNYMLYGKIVDLPTIIESLKTIDNKNFYKTADICHMMICKFEPEIPQPEEESPDKKKKKDPLKVDKKYLWPHGITPPCKNVRKRRFRKTLKKKYVEAPEIEKEVKRLLKIDNDAVHVKFEIINEEDEGKQGGDRPEGKTWHGTGGPNSVFSREMSRKDKERPTRDVDGDSSNVNDSRDVGEHEIFGEVSSSDDDDERRNVNILEDDNSLSADDSRMSDSNFASNYLMMKNKSREANSTTRDYDRDDSQDGDFNMPRDSVDTRISDLRHLLVDLKGQRSQKEQEISAIQNQTLRQRLQDNLDNLVTQINDKEAELMDLESYQKRL